MNILKSDLLFRHLAEHSLVGIYIIQDSRYLYVNSKLAQTYGYTVEELLAIDDWLTLIPEPDRALVSEQVRRRIEGEVLTSRYATRGLRRDGTIIDVEIYGSRIELNGRPATMGNLIDITERVQAREALHESEELFRRAFDDTNLPMVLTDLNHRFVRVNSAFAQMFGYRPNEMLGMTTGQITHPDDLAESYARRLPLLAGKASSFEMEKRYLHRDGHVLSAVTNVALVRDAAGQPRLYVGQVQDMTDRKRLIEQVHQSQKMEAIGILAAGVAHDFNNLLTVMNGYCEVIQRDPGLTPLSRDMVREIHRAGDRATSLTRQLLAFSRKQVLAPEVLDLNALVRETLKFLGRLVGASIDLTASLDPHLGHVKADPCQVELVLMNLVVNARDAMANGGKMTIETHRVELDQEYCSGHLGVQPGWYVQLAVSDTGIGMDAATQARIFEPFFTTKGVGKGTGLGLATVHGIVRQSGGHISVYSEPGRGATFKVYLPLLADDASVASAPIQRQETPRGTETILLAEDEAAIRDLASLALKSSGYSLLDAADGEQALQIATAHPTAIDLLVTDLVMPKLSGRELAERMRLIHPNLRVLFVSGYSDDAIVRNGLVSDAAAFLQKPFTPTILARKVREVLDAGGN
ncbi:MAG TPA: PAS domain S-box protein [Gemmataceae bacterium]|jgi:PAS domain S-box-containing protein|nr:PAS domain S-box protein [Gemmataceae bacterium]